MPGFEIPASRALIVWNGAHDFVRKFWKLLKSAITDIENCFVELELRHHTRKYIFTYPQTHTRKHIYIHTQTNTGTGTSHKHMH